MKNGFGFKDFVSFVLLLGIALSMWLLMVQRDRQWVLLQRVDDRLLELEKRIQQIRVAPAGVASDVANFNAANSVSTSDNAWARPGVKVEQWKAPTAATDPAKPGRIFSSNNR